MDYTSCYVFYHIEQNNKTGRLCDLFCSKGVLGLEINEVIRGITTYKLYLLKVDNARNRAIILGDWKGKKGKQGKVMIL